MLNFDNDNNLEDRKFYLDLESLKLRKFLEKEINYGIFGTSAPTVSIKQYYDEKYDRGNFIKCSIRNGLVILGNQATGIVNGTYRMRFVITV